MRRKSYQDEGRGEAGVATAATDIRNQVATLKRERIVSVAADLFYERGYENTNLDAVAEVLGVTKPFIYSYFKSKSDLLGFMCSRGISSSFEALDRVLASSGTATGKLEQFGVAFSRAVLENQKYIAIFNREEKNLSQADLARINAMRREFDHRLTRLLDEGVAAGEFRISDTKLAALAIGGMVSWAYVWYRPSGRLDSQEVAEQLAELIVAMAAGRKRVASRKPLDAVKRRGS